MNANGPIDETNDAVPAEGIERDGEIPAPALRADPNEQVPVLDPDLPADDDPDVVPDERPVGRPAGRRVP